MMVYLGQPRESQMGRWSESCFDPHSGEPLREFDRRSDAVRGVKLDPFESRIMEPYRCDKCHHWHSRPLVDPGPIPTDTMCLMCRGRDGQPKVSHPTFDAAQSAASNGLSAYPCPHGRGWHLTKVA